MNDIFSRYIRENCQNVFEKNFYLKQLRSILVKDKVFIIFSLDKGRVFSENLTDHFKIS
jgi:hypothetical protein